MKHCQFDVVEMFTVDSGSNINIAETLHVNSTVGNTLVIYFVGYAMLVI